MSLEWSSPGGENHSRLEEIHYPSGKEIGYHYASGLDDAISRLTSIFDNSGTLEAYQYLGLGTVVERDRPQADHQLTYITLDAGTGDAGDPYVGLDRFGRIVDQHWYNTDAEESLDRFLYGYDRNSNRTYRENALDALFSELYQYDSLNQLTLLLRGELNLAKDDIASPTASQSWNHDVLGNWTGFTDGQDEQEREHSSRKTRIRIDPPEVRRLSGSGRIVPACQAGCG